MDPIGSPAWVAAGVKHRRTEIEASPWLTKVLRIFEDAPRFTRIRCLGLGAPTDSQNARFQLALLLILKDFFKITKVSAWDPIFTTGDIAVLAAFSISVLEHDDDASYSQKTDTNDVESTLWYVPHGPASLNLQLASALNVNWFFGNNLSSWEPRRSLSPDEESALENYRASVETRVLPSGASERWFTAFNDLAVQIRRST